MTRDEDIERLRSLLLQGANSPANATANHSFFSQLRARATTTDVAAGAGNPLLDQLTQLADSPAAGVVRRIMTDAKAELVVAPGSEPPAHWLWIYRTRQAHSERAGNVTHGFSALFLSLERLPEDEPLSIVVYGTPNALAFIWVDRSNRVVGHAAIEHPS